MKKLQTLIAVLALASLCLAEGVSYSLVIPVAPRENGNQYTIAVPANSTFELDTFSQTGSGSIATLSVSYQGVIVPLAQSIVPSASIPQKFNVRVVGPANILVDAATINAYFLTYRLIATDSSPTSSLPSNSVVIPSNASGPVTIVLESSTDLINWTAALPGPYIVSTEKRFFRVRAVIN